MIRQLGQGQCPVGLALSLKASLEQPCRVGRVWQRLNTAIRRSLHEVTLAQLAGIDSAQVRLPTLEREVKLPIPRAPVR